MLIETLDERIVMEAQYIIDNNATIRKTAKAFNLSKSTVHKDVSYKLEYINERLFKEVKAILENNLKERHIRGGLATKRKFSAKRTNKDN